jgi:hypothetical protein
MVNEGIMALPQGMDMQGEQPQAQRQSVSSADSYDATQTALGMTDPAAQEAVKAAIRESLADEQLSPQELQTLIVTFEELSQNPAGYKEARQQLIDNDYIDPEDLPEEYDVEFLGAVLAVLSEMQLMQGQGAMEPLQMSPTVEGLAPMGMAEGGLADVASYLASQGRNGDSMLAHITPEEAALLKRRGGSGTINPVTGLPEFFLKKMFKSIGKAVKKVLSSPVGRILGTIALGMVLGPAGIGLQLGSTAAASAAINAGLAGAGATLLGGGSLKEALISGAMGYVGGGGTIMGASPVSAVGSYLPGAAGSALNTGLSTGLIGAGIGKLGGMSTQDALRMGLTSGASAAALQGLQNSQTAQAAKDAQFRSDMAGPPQGAGTAQDLLASPSQGPVGAAGPTGTAQDLLASGNAGSGIRAPSMGPSMSYDAATGTFRPDYSIMGAPTPGGGAPALNPGTFAEPGIRMPGAFSARDFSVAAGGSAPATNYSLSPAPASATAAAPTGFLDRMVQGGKDLYSEYLSPSRPGLPADAGMIRKYGPLAAAGTAALAVTGGMGSEPAVEDEITRAERQRYLDSNERARQRQEFIDKGGYGLENPVFTPQNPIVPASSYGTIPIGQPGTVVPMGATMSPGGVAQPYNVAGMYGVPLIYGPDGQPRRMAKGGDAKMTQFPRRNGPINGPGTGTSDDIPAMLSDGEFVFTAKAVRNAGGGSRRKGAARMYKLMKKLEGGAVKGN